eukprot:TRINITY_DN6163_c0_g1_i1.p1 TRINITY_DN6163_c0_g1~~TRINITY_DN6163_c0_g1_i1.p1  ORF type:complete len:603 (+),score=113.39 TRINITY_DN6163_c0_g1_i1:97-1905(+)
MMEETPPDSPEIERLRRDLEKNQDEEEEKITFKKEDKKKIEESIVVMSAREQEIADEETYQGILAFFQNRILEAEATFKKKSDVEPLSGLGLGAVVFLKALMTFNETDIQNATQILSTTRALTGIYSNVYKTKPPSLAKRLLSLSFSSSDPVNNGELRATIIQAECCTLISIMQLLQETIVGYVKAGWNLRRGYKEMSWAYQQIQKVEDPYQSYDVHTVTGVQFAFGVINVLLASLPPKIMKLVSFFGFSCDKELGYDLLHKSFEGNGGRSPLASLFLLAFYALIPSFVPVFTHKYIEKAKDTSFQSLQRYPGSALHVWLAGRVHRLTRDLDKSTDSFLRAVEAQIDFVQVKHLCFYDLGLNHMWKLEWNEAKSYFDKLIAENYWSKAFYVYASSVCIYMMGDKEKAVTQFRTVASYVVRKYGGRTISVEQYVVRKVKMMEDLSYDMGCLPGLELIYLWNGYSCLQTPTLQQCLSLVNESLSGKFSSPTNTEIPFYVDQKAMLHLIKSTILANMGEDKFDEAFDEIQFVFENEENIKGDTFIPPFAYYELGSLYYTDGSIKESRDAFNKSKEFSKFNFEFRLALRLQLAIMELNREGTAKSK